MQRSLGKMSVHHLFDWRNCANDTIQHPVAAFLNLGEALATRWIQTPKGEIMGAEWGGSTPETGGGTA